MVFPLDNSPYGKSLYGEVRRYGARVTYMGRSTPSHALSIFLLPFETMYRRIRGARILHIHWVYEFAFPRASRLPFVRWVTQLWFLLWLQVCRLSGVRLVWTAHNVLPHQQVFADDVRARRALVRACALVFAHSETALDELAALGAVARRTSIIPHGPITPTLPVDLLRIPGSDDGPRRFLFLGRIQEYKGVEDLLRAFIALPCHVDAKLLVVGHCPDRNLKSRLQDLGEMRAADVALRLERVRDEEITRLLADADAVVLPFRRVTTSGSAMLALSHGRPLIVPHLPSLAMLPDNAVLRYDATREGLTEAIACLANADRGTLAAMAAAAFRYSSSINWQEIASITMSEMRLLSATRRTPDSGSVKSKYRKG